MSDAETPVDEGQQTCTNMIPSPIPEGEPPESYRDLGRDYPLALLAGGLVLGAVAGALLPRGISRKTGRGLISVATIASDAGLAYARRSAVAASEGREKIAELGGAAGSYGRKAVDAAGSSARKGRDLGITFAREVISLISGLRR